MSDYIAAGSIRDTGITYCSHKVTKECKRNIAHSYKNSRVVF